MNITITNPVLDHFLAAFRAQISDMEDRIAEERDSLSDWRKCEAEVLCLTDEEQDRLPALRILAAAPDMLEALKAILDPATNGDESLYAHSREMARAAVAKAEGR